jgi:alpha-beta hydrolase superfamily lysophospholipase
MKTYRVAFVITFLCLIGVLPLSAQTETPTPTPAAPPSATAPALNPFFEPVEITALDGLILKGDYYVVAQETSPTVLLLHILGSQRNAWTPLIPELTNAGYNVLNVDLRGQGETGGSADWVAAQDDTQLWLNWLNVREEVESSSIIGASIGSNLALINCANDAYCVTAVALSPGLDYRGVMPEDAVINGLTEKSALLVAAYNDRQSIDGVRQMATSATGEIGMRVYRGAAHGTNMFNDPFASNVTEVIVNWLDEHTGDQ